MKAFTSATQCGHSCTPSNYNNVWPLKMWHNNKIGSVDIMNFYFQQISKHTSLMNECIWILSVCWYHCISELQNNKCLSLLHHMYNSVLASWRKLSPFHLQVLSNTRCHFPNCLENIATIQDKRWLACQMSNTSTIHLQRSIHSRQGTSLFRKFVNHFDT
jgi:hypothetical protein